MKHLFVCVFLALSLPGCTGASAPGSGNCSKGVCVKVIAVEPILFDQPVTVTITVTSEEDMPGLKVFLSGFPKVLTEDAGVWKESAVNWGVDAKTNLPLIFTRMVRFPPIEGFYTVIAEVYTPSLRVVHSMVIHLTRAGGKVYLSGTPIPITPGPLPTITPGPSPTFMPTPTRAPYP